MLCFQKLVTEALMELAWETDHDDYVSESACAENASIGNVFEIKGSTLWRRPWFDGLGGMLLWPCLWFAELQKLDVGSAWLSVELQLRCRSFSRR